MKFRFLNILLFLLGFQSYAQDSLQDLLNIYNTRSIPYISVEELRMIQTNGNVTILDTRERAEYEVSQIEGARYIGFSEFSIKDISEEIPVSDDLIVVYCSLGIRSEKIGEKLKKAGYTNVRNLYGGIFEWKNKNYPVLDSEGTETENVHAYSRAWAKWLNKGTKVF